MTQVTPEELASLKEASKDCVFFATTYCVASLTDEQKHIIRSYQTHYQNNQSYADKGDPIMVVDDPIDLDCAAIFILWYAVMHHVRTIVLTSSTQTDCNQLLDRIRELFVQLPEVFGELTIDNNRSIQFSNNTRIISHVMRPNLGRGMSISFMFVLRFDEMDLSMEEFKHRYEPHLFHGVFNSTCVIHRE